MIPSPAELFGYSGVSMLGATMTTELVLVAFASPSASLAESCFEGGGGAAGKLLIARNGGIPPVRRRQAWACCSSRMNPWNRFRRIHLPKLTTPYAQHRQYFDRKRKGTRKTHAAYPRDPHLEAEGDLVYIPARLRKAPHQKRVRQGVR